MGHLARCAGVHVTRSQLEHIIRAASVITDDDELVIVGSQAILGPFPDAPPSLLVSVEADVYPKHHPDRADLIDGSIGELSPFHEAYGYYAHGVGPETATLPEGWEQRAVPIHGPGTRGAIGWCPDAHDLVLSKYVAFREKDEPFVRDAIRHRLVVPEMLIERLAEMPIDQRQRAAIAGRIERHVREIAEPGNTASNA
jgi:hypothetical protein